MRGLGLHGRAAAAKSSASCSAKYPLTYVGSCLYPTDRQIMERFLGAFGRSVRTILPRLFPNMSSGDANMSRTQSVHLARVKEAMDSLAPKGQALPSQGRALASEAAGIGEDGQRTSAEIVAAANALFQVGRSSTELVCSSQESVALCSP